MTVQDDLRDILSSVNYTWTSPSKPSHFKLIQELEGGIGAFMMGSASRGIIIKRRQGEYVRANESTNNVYRFPVAIVGDTDADVEALFVKIKSIVDAFDDAPFTVNSNDYHFCEIIEDEDKSNEWGGNPFIFDTIITLAQILKPIVRSG